MSNVESVALELLVNAKRTESADRVVRCAMGGSSMVLREDSKGRYWKLDHLVRIVYSVDLTAERLASQADVVAFLLKEAWRLGGPWLSFGSGDLFAGNWDFELLANKDVSRFSTSGLEWVRFDAAFRSPQQISNEEK